jgi:hypothetical protein
VAERGAEQHIGSIAYEVARNSRVPRRAGTQVVYGDEFVPADGRYPAVVVTDRHRQNGELADACRPRLDTAVGGEHTSRPVDTARDDPAAIVAVGHRADR